MKIFGIISIGVAAFFLLVICGLSEARQVTYLPRDQVMRTVTGSFGASLQLKATSCAAETGGIDQTDGLACLGPLLDCPDCCLDSSIYYNGRPQMRSAPLMKLQGTPPVPVPVDSSYNNQTKLVFKSNDGSDQYVCPVVRNCTSGRAAFRLDECATNKQAIANCQALGCRGAAVNPLDNSIYISAEPYPRSKDTKCKPYVVSGVTNQAKWICDTNESDMRMKFPGCNQTNTVYNISQAYYKSSSSTPAICKTQGLTKNADGITPVDYCSTYTFTKSSALSATYTTEIQKCIDAAQGFERYERDTNCLLNGDVVCPSDPAPFQADGTRTPVDKENPKGRGFMKNCSASQCQTRIDWKKCNPPPVGYDASLYSSKTPSYTDPSCCDQVANTATSENFNNYTGNDSACLRDTRDRGDCFSCFSPLGTYVYPFYYDFSARTDQKIVVLWQLMTTPYYCLTSATNCPVGQWNIGVMPTAYLYTMIKVFELTWDPKTETNIETEVFPLRTGKGTLLQRPFAGASSISAATVVDKDFFKEGKRYRVRLYYYIPSINNVILQVEVSWGQLMIIQTRD